MIQLNQQDIQIVELLARERWRINRGSKHVKNFRNFQPDTDFEVTEKRGIAGEMAFAKHVGIWFPTSQDPAIRVNEPDLYFGGKTIDVKTTWKARNLNLTIKDWEDTPCDVYVLMYCYENTGRFDYVGYALHDSLVRPDNRRKGKVFPDGFQAPDYYQLPEHQLIKSLP